MTADETPAAVEGPGQTDTDWQERIVSSSSPYLVIEHVLRYRAAVPLIAESAAWVDLGTGEGVAASLAIESPPDELLLVDVEPAALAEAGRRFPGAHTRVADLCDADQLADLTAAIHALPTPVTITAFEIVEHLRDHTPLLGLLLELARERDVSVVLSVPNDAFTGVENPYHLVKWGAESFEEMLSLLPPERVTARQVALAGSAIYIEGSDAEPRIDQSISCGPDIGPSHLLVSFGPLCSKLDVAAAIVAADTVAQRAWERQREVDLAYYQTKSNDVPRLEEYVRAMEPQ